MRLSNIRRGAILAGGVMAVCSRFVAGGITDNYVGPDLGQWSNPANWSAGVPNNGAQGFNVFISVPETIQLNAPETIDTLALTAGTLSLLSDALTLASASLQNSGTILLNNPISSAQLVFRDDTILSGGGVIIMSGAGNRIDSGNGAIRLISDNRISGEGTIGSGQFKVVNTGSITATAGKLTINANPSLADGFINLGTLAADGGSLVLGAGTYTNTSGIIEARANSSVTINSGATISGGTVRGLAGGTVSLGNMSTGVTFMDAAISGNVQTALNLSGITMAGNLSNAGTLASVGTPLIFGRLSGNVLSPAVMVNTGVMQIGEASATLPIALSINANTTLTGGGTITFAGGNTTTSGGPYRLSSDNFISGSGTLGTSGAGILLTNAGTITATGVLNVVASNILTSSTSTNTINTGIFRADGGTLILTGGGNSSVLFANAGGTIEARDNSLVSINNSVIVGGTVRSLGSGTIALSNSFLNGTALGGNLLGVGAPVTLGGTLTNTGSLSILGGNFMLGSSNSTVSMAIANTGLMQIGQLSGSLTTNLTISSNISLSGGGTLILSSNANSTGSSQPFTLTTDNLITGHGALGSTGLGLALVNTGTITASGGLLTLPGTSSFGIGFPSSYNTGLLSANGGTLAIAPQGPATLYNNTGGMIEALANSVVSISCSISGGNVGSIGGGTVTLGNTSAIGNLNLFGNVQASQGAVAAGNITNAGTLSILGGAFSLGIVSSQINSPITFTNAGVIQIGQAPAAPSTFLAINTDVTLSGGGSVVLTSSGSFAPFSSFLYRLTTNNAISGSGSIGNTGPGLLLTNTGTITATSGVLSILGVASGNPSNPSVDYNMGFMRASGALLSITGGNNFSYVNTGGVIEAFSNSAVALNQLSLSGGILRSSGNGTVTLATTILANISLSGLVQSISSTLLGSIQNSGTLSVNDNLTMMLGSTTGSSFLAMSNNGLIQIGNNSRAMVLSDILLTGGGTMTTRGSIIANVPARLTTDNFISGQGSISGSLLKLTNSGTITATGGILTLSLSNATDSMLNLGILRADAGVLTLNTTTYTNLGLIEAVNGGTVNLVGTAVGGTFRTASGGVIALTGSNQTAPNIILFAGGTLQFSSSNTMDYSPRFSQQPGQLYMIDTGGQAVSFATPLTSMGGTFTKTGLGTLTFTVPNTYDGLTIVNRGILRYGTDNAIAAGAVTVSGTAAALDLNNHADTVGVVTLDGGTITGGTLTSTASFEMKNGVASAVLAGGSGQPAGSVPLNKTSAGTVILTGSNTYNGGTNINGGVLQAGSLSALGPAGVISFGGGLLQYSAVNTTDYSARFSQAAGQMYGVDTNGQAVTFNTALTSAGGTFTKAGAGTLSLNVANTYDGQTTVTGGILRYNLDDATASGPMMVNGPSAVLDLNGHRDTAGLVTLDGGGSITGGTVTSSAGFDMRQGSADAILAGSGGLTKTTAGTLFLTGANTYSGGTHLNGGVLQLGSAGAIGTSGIISFAGGTLQLTPMNTTDYSNRFSNDPAQALGLDTNGQNATFATALVSAGGSLTKSGTGTLTLPANNNYGTTRVTGGTLQVGNGGAAGTLGSDALMNNGTVVFNRADVVSFDGGISGAGNFIHAGAGTTTLSGAYSATGSFALNAGNVIFDMTAAARNSAGVLLKFKSQTIAPASVMDVTNHDLMIGNTTLTQIENEILTGFNKGTPGGPAITSSTALSLGSTMLIPLDADAILGNGTPGSAIGHVWDNTPITEPGTVIVSYAISGDLTLDGAVDGLDYATAVAHFGAATPGFNDIETSWLMGDTNFDGVVNAGDFAVFGGASGGALAANGPSAQNTTGVPEPASLLLLGLGGMAALRRRKFRR